MSEHDARRAVRKEDLPEYKRHAHLRGVRIGIREAAEKYDIPHSTLARWVERGYIARIAQEGQKVLINEQDAAYCAEVYRMRGGQGRWLFYSDGVPYIPKREQSS